MKEKMISFLTSIGINDYESFDIDFDMVNRNRFDRNTVEMVISKETPWEYELLNRFIEGLNTITTYKTNIRFIYKEQPSGEKVITLFKDWYRSIYRIDPNVNLEANNNDIKFKFDDLDSCNEFASIIQDFKDFLKFIQYDLIYVIPEICEQQETCVDSVEEINLNEVAEEADAFDDEEIISESNDDAIEEENQLGEINDRNDLSKQIQKEQEEKNKAVEDALLKEMKRNQELMKKERERARINKRGAYQEVERIDDLTIESDHIDIEAFIFSTEIIEKNGSQRCNIGIADQYGGAIKGTCFLRDGSALSAEKIKAIPPRANARIRGVVYNDEYNHQMCIKVHYLDLLPPDVTEVEPFEQNRVELHLHTNMSTQDGVTSMDEYGRLAKALGHKAMAITDHATVQAFPDAQHAAKDYGLKILYGCEFYMVDAPTYIYNQNENVLNKSSYVVFDLETTGLSSRYDKITEFGAVKIVGGTVVDRVDILINPGRPIPKKIVELTGITDELLKNKPGIASELPKILEFISDSILVTHNAQFDIGFLNEALKENGYSVLTNGVIDTLALSRYNYPESRDHNLGSLCKRLEVVYKKDEAHRADYDAFVLSEVWQIMLSRLTEQKPNLRLCDLEKLETSRELLMHLRPHHVVAIAKNMAGVRDLFDLVSIANVDYLAAVPLIPRRVLQEKRSNLLLGSACFNGDVFATAQYYNRDRLINACKFYDFIEVQPPENYSYLVNIQEIETEDVHKYIKDIIDAGKAAGKLVVATGDVHYLSRKEKIFRDVLISAPQVGKINHPLNGYKRNNFAPFENPDQHYRSTQEMLDCFSFLPEDLRKEIVITNSNLICDMVEEYKPVPNNKLYAPEIENGEEKLKELCYNTAKSIYGDPLPEYIQTRLDTELNGIISNGYSVIYYFAHKLVKKANDDGYIVGSRGSVGSSFAATTAGITEVNPLPAHYICPKCHHLEWGKENYPNIKSGFDLPAKKCPICGEEMHRDGQNIPFETFLGFHAEKTPDIDLNFPGDYQPLAHNYTKVLVGENNVFRAGTIETVAGKTAYGFAKGYIERKYMAAGMSKEEAEAKANLYPKSKIEYYASGCVGVKRTTGQHPGGIVVVPNGHNVNEFTPIQWPADEVNSDWKTTHLDYHSIDETLLKFDMLGHVDPVALRMMCLLTNINIKDIPLSDPKVLKLFSSPEPLGLKVSKGGKLPETGALAIPEFGTVTTRKILEKTRPTTFNELVIISGISHGEGIWAGNAEQLIQNNIATLQEVIGCRDDIMTYLISKGIPAETSFAIMEKVRKGKGLTPEHEEAMRVHNVPSYYIDSCKKIKYMFPKGHAVAYVTQAVRVGYFKVYYPLEFYATFFSVRSKAYDIIPMIKGEEAIIKRLDELKALEKTNKQSPKEEQQQKTLAVALEMVQRGYTFSNIDLYKSDANNFVVDYERKCLIPPFATLDGLGENNAVTVIEARKDGAFTSKEDLLRRTKLTSTNVAQLSEMGVLDELDDTDQMSLFDFC